MRKILKKNAILIIALLAYLITFIIKKDVAISGLTTSLNFLKEMLEILPPIIFLSSLAAVWISKDTIVKYLGTSSGVKGKIISLLVGSFSAGPIYAAFPVCSVLWKKGAAISNIVIILSSWAVIKVPMLLVEVKFLGPKFTLIRYILTLPAILITAFLIEKIVKPKDINSKSENKPETEILEQLPGYNCKACGYKSCDEFSKTVVLENAKLTQCIHIGK